MTRRRAAGRLDEAAHAGLVLASAEAMPAIARSGEQGGRLVRWVDLSDVRDKQGLLTRIAQSLDFPSWFGHNWDALEDSLTDLSWLDAPGWVLLFPRSATFRALHPDDFATALQVLQAAAAYWRDEGRSFSAVIDAPGEIVPRLPDSP